jgi:L-ascorbate metabolism protein UlaG (beta-lactamase superfamily)
LFGGLDSSISLINSIIIYSKDQTKELGLFRYPIDFSQHPNIPRYKRKTHHRIYHHIFTLQFQEQLSPSGGGKVSKRITNLVSLAIIIAVLSCAGCGSVAGSTGSQTSISQNTSGLEEQSQPTVTLAPATQTTEEQSPYSQIQSMLQSNPACGGDETIRKAAILMLDEILKSSSATFDPDLAAFYRERMAFVESEINEPVMSGVRIWSMYNHGFIVKTPSTIFAFDLINGYRQWDYQIPDSILKQIQVLFVSHRHEDHRDLSVIAAVKGFGGQVVMPSEDSVGNFGTVYLSAGDEVTVAGLQVKAYDGLHDIIPVRIFQVTTPEGVTIMHTGDNQTSETLPNGVTVDILLLNAWVNESGSASPVVGIRNSINKLQPKLTILGHIQEMSHRYDPSDVKSRLSYEAIIDAGDAPLPGELSIQIWGEHCDFPTK